MPDAIHFTDSEAANQLLAEEPMALLVGFALDQQVTVQKAFTGPLAIRERLGALDAETLATADLEAVFRAKPAVHRFPAAMATRVQALAVHLRDEYGGDAARVWTDAADAAALKANLEALPGFGAMKVTSLAAVLAKRFGVPVAMELLELEFGRQVELGKAAEGRLTLGDVDSAEALAAYQADKRAAKAARRAATA